MDRQREHGATGSAQGPGERLRLDKWLWQARFFRTRTLAATMVAQGGVRVNGTLIARPAQSVGPGDTLTFAQGGRIRVVRIIATGTRRGPAPEAARLYRDLDLAAPTGDAAPAPLEPRAVLD